MRSRLVALLLLLPLLGACSREGALFVEHNARAHVGMLAGTIGSRPVGTPANARAREYIVEQLRLFGFAVRIQEADARRPELGRTARVSNIIAVKGGRRDEAVGLLSHYDSSPDAPGAADDAFGVAVSLEAARVLAARGEGNWSLMVLMTDGEEAGLLGGAAMVNDPEITKRLHAYLNIEAAGSAGPARLFENGPGNGWLVDTWARHAPHPNGASFGVEIYERLPNDTDFTIFRRHGFPGLNFALIDDSYSYHTARDTPERLSSTSLRETGENVVAIVSALDQVDITQRSTTEPTYFDIGRTAAVSYGSAAGWLLAGLALATGVVAWVRITGAAIRLEGVGRWILTVVWTILGAVLVVAAMIGATSALRSAREVYHPWYAHPDRLFVMLTAVGIAVSWSIARLGRWLPRRAHGLRHPLITWSLTLPVWLLLGSASLWFAPGAASQWILPLLAAGVLLSLVPPGNGVAIRLVSVAILIVVGVLWLRNTVDLLQFMVTVFGRFAFITPVYVYAAIISAAGLMLVPPVVAIVMTPTPLVRPSLMTAVWLLTLAFSFGLAYAAPAYTHDRPLRRAARVVQTTPEAHAIWEVASLEPGLDLEADAPPGWMPAAGAPPTVVPEGRFAHPFVFRTTTPPIALAPVAIADFRVEPLERGLELILAAVPGEPGLTLSLVLPEGLTPARSNLPGAPRRGRWAATYVAPPEEGVVFRASFEGTTPDVLRQSYLVVTSNGLPEGEGWQSLPRWLPQDRTVWSARTIWHVAATSGPAVAPVAPLR